MNFSAENDLRSQSAASADDTQTRVNAWDVEKSWIVEAPAGSGKTELLIQRYLRLLARVEQPEQVLAITFTRKAAAEMRDRILQSLRDAQNGAAVPEGGLHKAQTHAFALEAWEHDRRLGWNLVKQPQRMNIGTIDALCAEITAQLPVLSGLRARLTPVEDASPLYRSAALATIQEMGGGNVRLAAAAQTLLLHLDNRMEFAVDVLAGMLESRNHWGNDFPISEEYSDNQLDEIIQSRFEIQLRQNVAQTLEHTFRCLPEGTWIRIFDFARYVDQQLKNSDRKNICAGIAGEHTIAARDAEHLSAWKAVANLLLTGEGTLRTSRGVDVRIGFAKESPRKKPFQELLASLVQEAGLIHRLAHVQSLPPAAYTDRQREILRASFLLLRRALGHLQIAFAESGTCDFVEIFLASLHALRNGPEDLAAVFGTKIQHLLVDEMQDTSTLQFDLLGELTRGWDGCNQTIFLVGDPKQSIYRFRRVQVGLFARARDKGLNGIPLHPLFLTGNFRSRASLVRQMNETFVRTFDVEQDADGIRFAPARAAHEEEDAKRLFWHPQIVGGGDTENSTPADKEAREVCDVICRIRAGVPAGETPPSIAILVRARTHLVQILDELRRRAIPYRAIDLDTMRDRQAMLDLLSITRCLLHPADRIAWLAVLRAPWCGLTLADLHTLTGGGDAAWKHSTVSELIHERLHLLSADGQRRAGRVTTILEAAMEQTRRERLSLLVEMTWRTLGGPDCVSAYEVNSTNRFFLMLNDLERSGGWPSARQVEECMDKLFEPPAATNGSPVEVLTIFKAKGLEWDVVLMPGLHRRPRRDDGKLLEWTELVAEGSPTDATGAEGAESGAMLLAPVKHVSEDKEPIAQWIHQLNSERDRLELRRLLYVGCTRARCELHLFAERHLSSSGDMKAPHVDSLLHAAWPTAQEHFQRHFEVHTRNEKKNSNVVDFPKPDEKQPGIAPAIAAVEGTENAEVTRSIPLTNFRRIRSDWQPRNAPADIPVSSPAGTAVTGDDATAPIFERSTGSLEARNFGVTMHAMMQPLAKLLAENADVEVTRKIASLADAGRLNLLRMGTAPQTAAKDAGRIVAALQKMAGDPNARWILQEHPAPNFSGQACANAGFEVPLTAILQGAPHSVRVDRMFLAGDTPLTADGDFLWIVDFKTSTHGENGLEQFLQEERALYNGQLNTYANAVKAALGDTKKIRLGLYYPLLSRFDWWPQESPA